MRVDFTAQWGELVQRAVALRWRLRRGRPAVADVDYRDRISVVTWLIVFGLGLSIVFDIPTRLVSFRALGSPVSSLTVFPQP